MSRRAWTPMFLGWMNCARADDPIRQLQLGYTLQRGLVNRLKINNARVYVSLDNFFLFTKYPGVDPEVGNGGGNSIGIDRGGYPIPRVALAGISFTF